MRIELMIAESQPAVLPLNYRHHKKSTNKCSGIRTLTCSPFANLLDLQVFLLGTRFAVLPATPRNLSVFIAVPTEQSCTI